MKKVFFLFFILITMGSMMPFPADGDFATKEWTAVTHEKPLLFYISGDGGFNKFSTNLCDALNKEDYDVIALNSRTYFDDKKTPEQTTIDITSFLSKKLTGRKNQQVVFIGYSFGADVLPFVLNRLPENFENNWADIFGGNTKRSMDVATEVNRLQNKKIVIINGSDDRNLSRNKITLNKFTFVVLPGGHHFDGDIDEIVEEIIKNM